MIFFLIINSLQVYQIPKLFEFLGSISRRIGLGNYIFFEIKHKI